MVHTTITKWDRRCGLEIYYNLHYLQQLYILAGFQIVVDGQTDGQKSAHRLTEVRNNILRLFHSFAYFMK